MKRIACCFFVAFVVAAMAPAAETTITLVEESGSVARGMQEVTFIFSSDFSGTVQGVAFSGSSDASISFRAQAGQTLGQIKYTVTSGNLRIVRIL